MTDKLHFELQQAIVRQKRRIVELEAQLGTSENAHTNLLGFVGFLEGEIMRLLAVIRGTLDACEIETDDNGNGGERLSRIEVHMWKHDYVHHPDDGPSNLAIFNALVVGWDILNEGWPEAQDALGENEGGV